MGSFLRRHASSSTALGASGAAVPGARDSRDLPALTEFLAAGTYESGDRRETGTVTLFFEGGVWKACLNDRDQGMVGFLTLPELVDAILVLEEALAQGKGEWRAAKPRGTGKR
jgi:hypothetical protein